MERAWRWVLPGGVLLGAVVVALTGAGPVAQALAAVVPGLLALGAGLVRLPGRPPRERPTWTLHAAAMGLLTVGYVIFHLRLQDVLLHGRPLPPWAADAFFLPANVLVVLALVLLGGRHRDRGATLDAGIAVVGLGVVVVAFLVRPLVEAQEATAPAVLTAAYPFVDLLALGLVVRWWLAGQGARGTAGLLAASFGCLLVGDTAFGALATVLPLDLRRWLGVPFSAALCLQAAAVLRPTVEDPAFGARRRRPVAWSRVRWVLVAGASALAPAVLLGQGVRGGPVDWAVTGVGSLLLAVLTLTRLHLAVSTVQRQATELGELARTDDLTGLPNRRTWDAELARSVERAGRHVSVALLDLDHFKRVNDTAGHAVGDQVLRDVAGAWRAALPDDAVLARYGGEEFAVLVDGVPPDVVLEVLEALRRSTPGPQTVSVGVAHRIPGESPEGLLARADVQLYRAKANGRNRVCEARSATAGTSERVI